MTYVKLRGLCLGQDFEFSNMDFEYLRKREVDRRFVILSPQAGSREATELRRTAKDLKLHKLR